MAWRAPSERRGLVERRPAPNDRRKRLVDLTAQGRATRARLSDCMAERRPSFGRLTTAELETFRDLLRRLARP
jgi:DNA-binding MarR family transcriptional regulator